MSAVVSTEALMRRVEWRLLDVRTQAQLLRRPAQLTSTGTASAVAAIIEEVRDRGDVALRAFGTRFDGIELEDFVVGEDEFRAAGSALSDALRQAIDQAAERIGAFHRAGMTAPYTVDTAPGVRCERVLRPIQRVGLYVPAGSAPLPSTALMLGVPARLAGCPEIVLCTPPRRDGSADPAVLHAARRCGIARVFKVGGAQAIAAMAYGTGIVPRCDKVFGPGNAYVTEAKRQVAMDQDGAAIDMPAGPSEVLVIADAGANPAFVAADLLSQAEHGPDSQVLLLSDADALLDAVADQLALQLAALPRADIARRALQSSSAIRVESIEQALEISNRYAPEHLILALRDARAWLPRVSAAGSVFLGDWAPEALGDYCSGTNHVLPTSGAARFAGGLNVASFQVAITVQEVQPRGIEAIGPCAVELARAEGLDAHLQAVALRLQAVGIVNAVIDTAAANPLALVREDLRDFGGYRSARSDRLQGEVWLNANESPWPNLSDREGTLRRYPDPQPQALRDALAALYGCAPSELLAGRGSDECIDLLVRAICRPGGDAIVITTPTFGMYAVSARLHGTRVVDVPLCENDGQWRCDFTAVGDAALTQGARLVFLCSPGNPTGALLPSGEIAALAQRLEGHALIIVDEAYIEFADAPSAARLIGAQRNIVVLRTLSKAHALAAARIGSVIADAGLIEVLRRCQAPYPLPSACVEEALRALARDAALQTRTRIATVRSEREAFAAALAATPGVRRAYASRANFLLTRFDHAQAAFDELLSAGVVVRDMRALPGLDDALRISIGTPEQNATVLSILRGVRA